MVVDYKKWDKLELSDDSDIEVHPNVDKQSFIRWKQRDIHEKREQMKMRMKQLEINLEMNQDLMIRLKKLIEYAEKPDSDSLYSNASKAIEISEQGETKTKPSRADDDSGVAPEYKEMVESLIERVTTEVDESDEGERKTADQKKLKTAERLKAHQEILQKAITIETREYHDLQEERSRHIFSEDIHTGWDSTLVNKELKGTKASGSDGASTSASGGAKTTTDIEVLNPNASAAPISTASTSSATKEEDDDDVQASPDALEYAKIAIGDFEAKFRFLMAHPQLASEREKDGLMMRAFELELGGQDSQVKRVVENALILQYCAALGSDGIRLFFGRIIAAKGKHPAVDALQKDVEFTTNHIRQRCAVISAENAGAGTEETEGVEQIQLHAVDPNTEIIVNVPEPGTDMRKIYDEFSQELRQAIETRKLDEINKVLANMEIEEAEDTVKKLGDSGVLSVEEKIYDADQWTEERERQLAAQEPANDAVESTVDEVD